MIRTKVKSEDTENQNISDVICPPDPERIVEGLRDTGYNFNTAMADIVDNSIAAKATQVDIIINMNPSGDITVYIADNGIGMDAEGLKNAMTYGSKVRPDLGSLGKFGLGLKTASTAFCRSLSVISRGEDGIVRKAQWDLDYVAAKHEWKLKMPEVQRDELDVLETTAEDGTGTLVVWEKVDRLLKNYSNKGNAKNALKRKIEDLQFHISMVYQRFLDENDKRAENVRISVNGVNIEAWDPFALSEELTEKLAEDEVEVEMPDGSAPGFTMKAYMLPNKESFSTTKAKNEARISNDMQGFYVYRENRLIHYGDWLGMFINEPHGSLLRVEFSFDHMLDSAFNVDIKKSRILPAEEILDYIKTKFIPAPRRAAEDRYRHGTAKAVEKQAEKRDAHAESNRNIEEKAKTVEGAKITVTKPDEIQIENQNGVFSHKITIISNPKPGQVRVITKPDLEYGQLWEPCIADGKHAVQINQSHPYYQKVYSPILAQNVMVTGMDALLWALAEAEHKTYNEEIKEHYEEMRIAVSRILKTLVADLPDPEEDDEDE
jgi:hypothetical protein